jgi:hypothetical protein
MRVALGAVFGVAVRAVVATAFFAAVITGFPGFLAAAFAFVAGLDAMAVRFALCLLDFSTATRLSPRSKRQVRREQVVLTRRGEVQYWRRFPLGKGNPA